jgi:hypothetical protein
MLCKLKKKDTTPALPDPKAIGELLRIIHGYEGDHTRCALRLAPLVFVRPGELLCLYILRWSHFDVALKQVFQALGVVFEGAADVDFFQSVVECLMGSEEVGGQGFGVVEPGEGFAGIPFTGFEDVPGRGLRGFVFVGR